MLCKYCDYACYMTIEKCSFPERMMLYKTIYYNFIKGRNPLEVIKINSIDIEVEVYDVKEKESNEIKKILQELEQTKSLNFFNCSISGAEYYIRMNNKILVLASEVKLYSEKGIVCVVKTGTINLFLIKFSF